MERKNYVEMVRAQETEERKTLDKKQAVVVKMQIERKPITTYQLASVT